MGKRIAFLGYNEPDGKTFYNGVVRVIYNQAQMLKERGYEVLYYHLFSREQYKGLNRFLKENAIDIALWHMTTLKIRGRLHTPCPLICLWHSTPFFHNDVFSFCEKYHIKGLFRGIMVSKLVNWAFVKLHDLFNTLAFLYVTACADKMVLLSEGFVSKFFPARVFPNRVTSAHNFLAKELIEAQVDMQNKKKEVLFLGRLDNKAKRLDLLLQIWSKVENCVNDWILNICGEGQDGSMLKKMKEDLGIRNAYFRGFVKPEDYYRTASVFCMTSAMEGFGLVLAEAACFGCVPMAFNSYEAVEDIITDNENGRLIQPFDIDAYANALMELIENEELRMHLALNAKRDVKRFGPEKIMDDWENLFEEVGNRRKKK